MSNFAIIGAELRGLDVYANYNRTSELRADLIKLGLSFVGVSNISKGVKSQLFIVTEIDEGRAIALARRHGQKAALISDELGNIEVVSTKSKGRTKLGKFKPVSSKDIAARAAFYVTFVEDGQERFFITHMERENDTHRTEHDCRST
jgi:hypothetical protein